MEFQARRCWFGAFLFLGLLLQGGTASAGMFIKSLEVTVISPEFSSIPAVTYTVFVSLGSDQYDWYLSSLSVEEPQNAKGESPYFDGSGDRNPDPSYVQSYWLPGLSFNYGTIAWLYPDQDGNRLSGRFTGGSITVVAYRYDEDGQQIYATDSVPFNYTIPNWSGSGTAVPEPSALASAAIATVAGLGFAVRRGRRRADRKV